MNSQRHGGESGALSSGGARGYGGRPKPLIHHAVGVEALFGLMTAMYVCISDFSSHHASHATACLSFPASESNPFNPDG